jgi:hypothetical protein
MAVGTKVMGEPIIAEDGLYVPDLETMKRLVREVARV